MLTWQPPVQSNGVLTGYEISYEPMSQHGVGGRIISTVITDPKQTNTKLASLIPATNYRIYIKAITKAGVGEAYVYTFKFFSVLQIFYLIFIFFVLCSYFVKQQTKSHLPKGTQLDKPKFTYILKPISNALFIVRILWIPKLDGNPGSHFFVKYK